MQWLLLPYLVTAVTAAVIRPSNIIIGPIKPVTPITDTVTPVVDPVEPTNIIIGPNKPVTPIVAPVTPIVDPVGPTNIIIGPNKPVTPIIHPTPIVIVDPTPILVDPRPTRPITPIPFPPATPVTSLTTFPIITPTPITPAFPVPPIATLTTTTRPVTTTATSDFCPLSNCYWDTQAPTCTSNFACPLYIRLVTVCPWPYWDESPPAGCTERCKPCRQKFCPAICIREIVCNTNPCGGSIFSEPIVVHPPIIDPIVE